MTSFENFKLWYSNIVRGLYPTRDAGFVLVMVAFPLLERYVRQKIGFFGSNLNPAAHDELARLIPELGSREHAKEFWKVYRHGLLHVVTSEGWLSHDGPASVIIDSGRFLLHPVKFAEQVLKIIEDDFETFAGRRPEIAFPEVYENIPLTNNIGTWAGATITVSAGTVLPQVYFAQ